MARRHLKCVKIRVITASSWVSRLSHMKFLSPIFLASKHDFLPEVATAHRFPKHKSRICAQT